MDILKHYDAYSEMTINIMSFGYKNSLPLNSDFVFDVRFIPNPFYLKSMKNLTGNNKKVKEYVLKWPQTLEFIDKTYDMINYLIPFYLAQSKTNINIAIGCTGGQHRSVAITNRLYELFSKEYKKVTLNHREIK